MRNFEQRAGLEYNTAADVLSAVFPLEPALGKDNRLAGLLRLSMFVRNVNVLPYHEVRKQVMEVLNFHEVEFLADDAGDHDLASVLDHRKDFIHRPQQPVQVRALISQ